MSLDPLDRAGFGALLIILSSVLLLYPETPSELLFWLYSWRDGPAMLPRSITWPLISLLTLVGIWNLLKAGVRLWMGINPKRGVMESLNGSFLLVVAFLLREYAERLMPITALIPSIIMVIGCIIIIRSTVLSILEGRRQIL